VGDPFIIVFGQQHFDYVDGVGNIWDPWFDGTNGVWNLQQITLRTLKR